MRQKTSIVALAMLLLMTVLCLPASAQGPACIYDDAGLLTAEQASALEQKAQAVAEVYGCGVYIITVNDFQSYVDTDSVELAAEAFFDGMDLGRGEERSGILLLLSMAERDYSLLAHGSGNTAFTDYGKDVLSEAFLDDFGNDDWNTGFQDYLDTGEWMLNQAALGTPVDQEGGGDDSGMILVCILIGSAIVGFVIAGAVVGSMKRKLRSVAMGAEADAYVVEDSLRMRRDEDRYTHTTQARVYIPPKESRDSGGTSVNSRGFSSKSGKF